ncbi:MAG: hypothetical protein KC464_09230, partial [Myxococcales bacterium]|nr:hypothetical protein [Myxococcales bacterium]
TSSELDDDALRAAGISPGLVRLSLGYTGAVEDRWQQLHAALVEVGTLDRQNIGTQANRTGTPS